MLKSVAHLTSLPSITLKFDTFSPPHRDLLREKVKLFPFEKWPKFGCEIFSEAQIKKSLLIEV